jgi:hypothetical protein
VLRPEPVVARRTDCSTPGDVRSKATEFAMRRKWQASKYQESAKTTPVALGESVCGPSPRWMQMKEDVLRRDRPVDQKDYWTNRACGHWTVKASA